MRPAVLLAARAVLLAGPTVLAFASGGYFEGARLVAAVTAWALVAVLAVAVPGPLRPGGASGAVAAALGGLALLVAWTAVSASWAPLPGPAGDSAERGLLYLAAVAAAFLALRPRAVARAAEPVLMGGILVVIAYGIAGRVLPALVEQARTAGAGGRLDQPLTYWNAEGALAAAGLVLAARVAGDGARRPLVRLASAAAAAPLGLGVHLTFSRGALAALGIGIAVLVAVTPTWTQLRSAAIALEATAACAIVASALPAVRQAEGDGRTGQGLVMLAALAVVMAAAAGAQAWSARAEAAGTTRTGPLLAPARVRLAAWGAAALLALAPFAAAVAEGGAGPSDPAFGARTERLSSAGSNRYGYWKAAVEAWSEDPAIGGGAGSFAASWLRLREFGDVARDAHSLELETAAELGLIGLALLLCTFAGFAAAARRTLRDDPGLVAGPVAVLALWVAHSAIDWDWEMPAFTLVPALLAGLVLAQAAIAPRAP